ncbi:MAG: hypothetical protein RMK29_06810 [Myxococcales bacterium]|nr:hypothetical protein [Myxococcota bacterium]MDW8281405.1 hypothetical protein [Myxococcales bacterium]
MCRRIASGLAGLLLLPVVTLAPACQQPGRSTRAEEAVPAGRYPDGSAGLQQLWQEVLRACQRDERQRVHDLLASMMMTQRELAELLGPHRAAALWPRYQALMGSMINPGSVELVAYVYEKKYDDVAVIRVDTLPEAEQQPTDRQVLAAMVQKRPLYAVRLKRKSEAKGLRYDFFVYLAGRWRTGNQLGKYLNPEEPQPKGRGSGT